MRNDSLHSLYFTDDPVALAEQEHDLSCMLGNYKWSTIEPGLMQILTVV